MIAVKPASLARQMLVAAAEALPSRTCGSSTAHAPRGEAKGAHFYGTMFHEDSVPEVPRHFKDCAEMTARYGSGFADLSVRAIRANERDKTFVLLEGPRARR